MFIDESNTSLSVLDFDKVIFSIDITSYELLKIAVSINNNILFWNVKIAMVGEIDGVKLNVAHINLELYTASSYFNGDYSELHFD